MNFDEMKNVPSNADITEIAELANIQISRALRVASLTEDLRLATEALRKVQERDLPDAMAQAGVSEIKLPNGTKISIKHDVYASIPKDERYGQALQWLRDHDLGDVIKNEVTASFGRGEEEQAQACIAELQSNGWAVENKVTVHSSTLKALIREQLAKGVDVPMDTFGAGPITKAIIK